MTDLTPDQVHALEAADPHGLAGLDPLATPEPRDQPTDIPCRSCDGCGQVADTPDQEPWTAWANLPLRSAAAVLLGLVKPIPCPACGGTGVTP